MAEALNALGELGNDSTGDGGACVGPRKHRIEVNVKSGKDRASKDRYSCANINERRKSNVVEHPASTKTVLFDSFAMAKNGRKRIFPLRLVSFGKRLAWTVS